MHPSSRGGRAGLSLSEPRINPEREVRYMTGENTGGIARVPSSRITFVTSAEVHLQPAVEHLSNSTNLEQIQEDPTSTRIITPPGAHQNRT